MRTARRFLESVSEKCRRRQCDALAKKYGRRVGGLGNGLGNKTLLYQTIFRGRAVSSVAFVGVWGAGYFFVLFLDVMECGCSDSSFCRSNGE